MSILCSTLDVLVILFRSKECWSRKVEIVISKTLWKLEIVDIWRRECVCAYGLNSVIVGGFPGNRSCDCRTPLWLRDTVECSHSRLNHLILGGANHFHLRGGLWGPYLEAGVPDSVLNRGLCNSPYIVFSSLSYTTVEMGGHCTSTTTFEAHVNQSCKRQLSLYIQLYGRCPIYFRLCCNS